MLWANFTGSAYATRSPLLDAEACINLYLERNESEENVKRAFLYGTPGLTRLLSVGTSGCRGLYSQDGRTFAVIGNTLYEINVSSATTTSLGTIPNDSKPVFFASNGMGGNQLAISGGGQLFLFNLASGVFTGPISTALTFPAGAVAFINGYFILCEPGTLRFWYSALENGSLWPGSNYIARSSSSDNLVGLIAIHDRLWVYGTLTTEVYYNAPGTTPFLPYPGSLMSEGLASPYAVGVQGESLVWLGQSATGFGRILRATQYDPVVISTPALEFELAKYSTLSDAEILLYEQEGHPFAIWTFPSADKTWGYDARELSWHQRQTANSATNLNGRWTARGGQWVGGTTILVGDYNSSNIYTLDLNTQTDNGAMIQRVRRSPYPSAENQWLFLDQIEMGFQSGVGTTGSRDLNPSLMLRVSRDGGQTYSPLVTATMGPTGATQTRACWRRMGRVRGDRCVIEVSQSNAVKTAWGPGLYLRTTAGTGNL